MGQYRKRLEIIADILSVVKGGARKTRIMYQANLSYKLLIVYLRFVRESGLVSTQGKRSYVLTQKGHEFLEKYKQFSQRSEQLEIELKNIRKERGILEASYIPNAVNYDWKNPSGKGNKNDRPRPRVAPSLGD
jgi:predicted transcriptional regulator